MDKKDHAWCKGCDHMGWAGQEPVCFYILAKQGRRPHPGGVGCYLHTQKGGKIMAKEPRWDKTTAARLLQYGATGKAVAEAVGCTPPEISRAKDELLSMAVDPLTQFEAEKLLKPRKPFKLTENGGVEPVNDQAIPGGSSAKSAIETNKLEPVKYPELPPEATQTGPVITEQELERLRARTLDPEKKPDIVVDINIGKGKVHLEAEDSKVLGTLIDMLTALYDQEI